MGPTNVATEMMANDFEILHSIEALTYLNGVNIAIYRSDSDLGSDQFTIILVESSATL